METYVITEHGCFSLKFPIMKLKSDEERVFDETLAQIIKARRDKLNLSQQYISDNASVSRTTLVKWEKGEKTPITFDLYNVLKILYKNPSEFWNDFSATYEKNALPIREAAEKKKFMNYFEQTRKKRNQ